MTEKQVTIPNPSGLHARPAALLVREAGQFKSTVKLMKNGKEVDAKSLLGVMSLAAKQGDIITVKAEGEDAETAVETIVRFLEQLS
jgi:phosphocarrier protein HPr